MMKTSPFLVLYWSNIRPDWRGHVLGLPDYAAGAESSAICDD